MQEGKRADETNIIHTPVCMAGCGSHRATFLPMGTSVSLFLDGSVPTFLESPRSRWHVSIALGIFIIYLRWRCSRIIYGDKLFVSKMDLLLTCAFAESLIVLPPHGVQLETHRGPFGSWFVSRRFIPTVYVQDIIINEALRRWNVRYYLAVIVACPGQNIELAVAFEVSSFALRWKSSLISAYRTPSPNSQFYMKCIRASPRLYMNSNRLYTASIITSLSLHYTIIIPCT